MGSQNIQLGVPPTVMPIDLIRRQIGGHVRPVPVESCHGA